MPNMFDRLIDLLKRVAGAGAHAVNRAVLISASAGSRARTMLIAIAVLGACGFVLWRYPPFLTLDQGEMAVRTNRLSGNVSQIMGGSLLALPWIHQIRRFTTRDQVYRPSESASASGNSPFQSVEGLSIGVDLTIRYAIDPKRITALSGYLPKDLATEVVQPIVQGVIYPLFATYTVREIFSSKRSDIQRELESQLRPKLAADGILLRSVQMGKVDLPQDYRNGMDKLLAEELEAEKMRYTLELTEKRVKQTELQGEADKVRREKSAEAAASEQVIAAKGQEEAMQHVLPFKQKQIEQRQLEAEAEKEARIRTAEGAAQARRIEAAGEADSRQRLADAEVYRLDKVGRVNSEQMERESVLIGANPLLIQKTMADKLSDKIQVIIAAPPVNGGFIGGNLLGAK
jgi:regulator of protease activity HflC (stomatin/prohibitin superfamily)